MKRAVRQTFRVTGAILGAFGVFILLEIMVQAFGGGSHFFAWWALTHLEKIFRPMGHWFLTAPDWAWVMVVLVLGFPVASLLTWSVDEAGLGIKRSHKFRWTAVLWIILVTVICAFVKWARTGILF